ncbi:hypothetical protein [Singulisphaera acidiphila]|uniref:Uncharacterized protein n=1 Tax=Singulisphaera acidiphila (strain ATCC BAA-1392 / DSM 18658 / VKM B-2454 / MOB10) TaxID=886293 RepID=L0D5R6_SINAD|nr:hypothetical protein [Singulisphaera acidiphila]AGA24602.1 hypothetical protein Sinac_0144 [Singulisphaera acidiphila DSM 18658]
MAILVDEVRTERCAIRPSVREVCLVGVSRSNSSSGWGSGDRVTLAGRAYRIEATRAWAGRMDESAHYVHLRGIDEPD